MSQRRHYLCEFRVLGERHIVIWYASEKGGLLTGSQGELLSFDDTEHALGFAREHGIRVEPIAVVAYDFDRLQSWCNGTHRKPIDCVLFLDAWNMLVDIAATTAGSSLFTAADVRARAAYEKLFRASNLPAIAAPGEHYLPSWNEREVEALARVLRLGCRMVQAALGGRGAG